MTPYQLTESDAKALQKLNIDNAVATQAFNVGITPVDDELIHWNFFNPFFRFRLDISKNYQSIFAITERGGWTVEYVKFSSPSDALTYMIDKVKNFKPNLTSRINIALFYLYDILIKITLLPFIIYRRKDIFSNKNITAFGVIKKICLGSLMDASLYNENRVFLHIIFGVITISLLSHLVF